MADLPISLLPTADTLNPSDLVPLVQNGVTKKATVRTIGGTPLDLGPAIAASSVPVTIATDQLPIPVTQVDKEITQVSLSLLGIPRSEVALGIFGDVNTYDVNPLEWTSFPSITGNLADTYGVKHLSAESAAQISAPPGWTDRANNNINFSRLTSKRFFRYQPGRVSAGTFGYRADTFVNGSYNGGLVNQYVINDVDFDNSGAAVYNKDATVKKFGMFDNENGYYFEIRGTGTQDSFLIVRRTNSINDVAVPNDLLPLSYSGDPKTFAGTPGVHGVIIRDNLVMQHAAYFDTTLRATSADVIAGNFVTISNYPLEIPGQNAPLVMQNLYTFHQKNVPWNIYLKNLTDNWTPAAPLRVKSQYARVYEFRVPRSNFNYDQGNGQTNIARWPDVIGNNVTGQPVIDTVTGKQIYQTSTRNIDFTKVTMYKIEYSWYGAVGAQFLVYMPVDNQLARWVRLHHLRVSNQLASPSLGNPFLPFTYLNIAGASLSKQASIQRMYKYGASYLIDGGDKGTVKINSVSTGLDKPIYPDKQINEVTTHIANDQTLATINALSSANAQFNSFHIGSRIFGPGFNPNLTIQDVSYDGKLAFLSNNSPVGVTSNSISVTSVSTRGNPLVGIQVRDYINGVRNRSQVYPVRLSVGCDQRIVVQLVKNPVFPSLSGINGTYTTSTYYNALSVLTAEFDIPSTTNAVSFTTTSQFIPFRTFNIGREVVGSFYGIKGTLKLISYANEAPGSTGTYTFARFQPGNSQHVSLNDYALSARGAFTPELPLRSDGTTLFSPATAGWSYSNFLAAVNSDSYETRSPIPGTGEVLATFNIGTGGTDIDLSPYFGYDKQYLSYPLVENGFPDMLYVVAKTPGISPSSGGGSLTWEEQ